MILSEKSATFRDHSLMAGLTVEGPPVAPIGKLCRCPFRVGRVRKLCQNPPKIGFGFVPITGERPAFRQARKIFAAIVLAKPRKRALAHGEGSFEAAGCASRQI